MKYFSPILILAISLGLFSACSGEVNKKIRVNSEFASYVGGYTSGIISRDADIQIQLAEDYLGEIDYNQPIKEELFTFKPAVEGQAWWINKNTIVFRPNEKLKSGQNYEVNFSLKNLVEVPDNLSEFSFNFSTVGQNMSLYVDGLTTVNNRDLKHQSVQGRALTADVADSLEVEKSVTAFQGGNELIINWDHSRGLEHRFEIVGVERGKKESEVKIVFKGELLGVDPDYEELVEVPALGDFKVTMMNVIHEPDQYIKIHFSDPLQSNQDLRGLIQVEGNDDLRYEVDGHFVYVHLNSRMSGVHDVKVNPGIRNINGYKMQNSEQIELVFEGIKPNVRLVGDGTIIPTQPSGLLFPFEAVNLRAVDVYITQVFENNMLQFLQVNSLSGNYQMKRVSKEVKRKRIRLDEKGGVNLHEWNRFNLDLTEIIEVEPGAVYQVELRFKHEYSVYGCDGQEITGTMESIELEKEEDWNENGWSEYDYWYDYDYWGYEDYDYRERENPCDPSYYRNRKVRANVLASDIGIVAKAGSDKTMHVFLNDIRTTEPMSGITVEFYDYQQQLIGTSISDSEGMLSLKLQSKPFVIVAKNGQQKGYLKLRDGESLSMSKFDVAGATIQKGVKGFLYGERGVWRPGDSIYLAFMLEDKDDVLPENHPVTFKLIDPNGQVVEKTTTSRNVNGLYDFRTSTGSEDPTGNYLAKVNVGNRTFSKYLKVETVKPNRLKIYLDFGKEKLSQLDENNDGSLSVKWLHGAVAKNLRAKVNLTVNPRRTTFNKFTNYTFDDPLKEYNAEEELLLDRKVDENGELIFSPEINVGKSAPGMLTANFVTKVFEAGGGFSIDRHSIPYSPYKSYVGVQVPKGTLYRGTLVTDEDHYIDVASVDANGKPVSRSGLEVNVYKIEWRWWWDRYDSDLASYIASSSTVPVLSKKINTSNGRGGFNFRVDRPSWGRYLVQVKDPKSGHSTGKIVYVDWPYWARSQRTSIDNATMLSFSTDKETYSTGEQVKVSFPSSSKGKAIVAVESGTKVLRKYLIDTEKGETRFQFKTEKDMAPNVYVHVTLLQPHQLTENDLPIRMYGVAPITVEDPNSHFNPEIKMPDVLRPESTAKITVSEEEGKEMTYTLAVVDEGLLDLTNFKTPNPWNHFYAREALGVRTWDLYDDVMGAFSTELNKLLAVGGDGSNAVKKPNKANRFEPMVRYIGPFHLKKGEKVTHKIDVPNYVGSVRVMVVAGQDEQYGNAEKTVPVRSPLMVLGTLPRVLGPTEKVYLPVNVFAMEKKVKNVSVSIETNEYFKVNGAKSKSIQFAKIGDEVVNFELEVLNKIGIGKVNIVAKSGNEVARHEIELDVRTPNPSVANITETVIEAGQTWTPEFQFKGVDGTNSATIELSSFPPLNLDQRLKYLIRYPHGCIEQTTSSVFPQLALNNVMKLSNNHKIEIQKNVKAGVDRLRLFQTAQGGFAYWPGQTDDSEWGTNYGGHFILEAEALGYQLPSGMKKRWVKYQSRKARNYNVASGTSNFHGLYHHNDLTQAYRLYTLALADAPEIGAMNRLRESKMSLQAKWRLAAAYVLVGQKEVAQRLIKDLPYEVDDYRELSYTYGSDIRDEAMILETMILLKDKGQSGALAKQLADEMNAKTWMSTQTTAYCLLSMNKYLGTSSVNKVMKFTYSVDGKDVVSKSTEVPVYQKELLTNKNQGTLKVKNTGGGLLYAKLVVEGVPVVGDQSTSQSNMEMMVKYQDMNGISINPEKIEQGTDFMAVVTVKNPGYRGYLKEMTLNQIFPSGWEIHNTRMDGFTSAQNLGNFDYQDIRDDRVYTYYQLGKGKSKTFKIKLNATYLGKFYLPTLESEAMYDNTVNSRLPGKWVEVVPQTEATVSN